MSVCVCVCECACVCILGSNCGDIDGGDSNDVA
jgi:hypothetical protein